MDAYHLCLAWNWVYDQDFVNILSESFRHHGLKLLSVTPKNLNQVCSQIRHSQIQIQSLLDRASEEDPDFYQLIHLAIINNYHQINPLETAKFAIDKSTIHQLLSQANLPVPPTIIIPAFYDQPNIPSPDIRSLGEFFNIKPAHGGCGEGVILKQSELSQLEVTRKKFPQDKILLQTYVTPIPINDHQEAWFRSIYCLGRIFLCWWHTQTHIYSLVSDLDINQYSLSPLSQLTQQIAQIVKLGFFSSEIALTDQGFFIIDYINNPMDLRLQSKYSDGVPDQIIHQIVQTITNNFVA